MGEASMATRLLFALSLCGMCSALNISPAQRAQGAIEGSLVADAATMPLHWIYSTDSIAKKVEENGGEPAFYPKPSCPFYEYSLGQQTPYGQQSAVLLQTMSARATLTCSTEQCSTTSATKTEAPKVS